MGILNLTSDQIASGVANPVVKLPTTQNYGKLRFAYFKKVATVAGDDGTDCVLVSLPKGNVRVLCNLSRIGFSAFGADRVGKIGHKAYNLIDGTSQAAVLDAFDTGIDMATKSAAAMGNNIDYDDSFEMTSKEGVDLILTVTGGTWPVNGLVKGYVVFVTD